MATTSIGTNAASFSGNAGARKLSELSDVLNSISPANGDTLVFNSSTGQFKTEQPAAPSSIDLSAVAQDIAPDVDNVRSLGSLTNMWKDVFIGPGSLYVNGQKVIEDNAGTIVIKADLNQNVQIQSQGSGDIEFFPSGTGAIDMKGHLSIQAGKNLTSGDGNPINCPVGFTALSVEDLTVTGTTTTVNSQTVLIADNILTLNSNTTGLPTLNSGIEVERGDINNASIIWNEAADEWQKSSDNVTFTPLGGDATGGSLTYLTVTNSTAVAKDIGYIVLTTGGAYTLTLPAAPAAGDQLKVIDGEANASTNNITVARNGENIMGLAEDMIVNTDNANFVLVFINASKGWMIG